MKFTSIAGAYLLCSSFVSSRPNGEVTAALADDQASSLKEAAGKLNLTALHANFKAEPGPPKGVSYLAQKFNAAVVSSMARRNLIISLTPTKGIKYFAQGRNPLVEATLSERDFNLTDVEQQRFRDVAQSAKKAAAVEVRPALGEEGIKYLAQSANPAIGKMVRRHVGARDQPDSEVLEPRKLNATKVSLVGYKYLAQSKNAAVMDEKRDASPEPESNNAAVRGGRLLRRRLGSRHLPDTEVLEPRKLNITTVHHVGYKYLAQSKNAAVMEEKRDASPEPESTNAALPAEKMARRLSGADDQLDTEVLEPRKLNITKVDHDGYKYLAQSKNAAVMSERREASPEPVAQPEADHQPIPDLDADPQ
ncbi:MAG: hypothetical protein Q9212_007052 [Teloschistes hypoglaucus]